MFLYKVPDLQPRYSFSKDFEEVAKSPYYSSSSVSLSHTLDPATLYLLKCHQTEHECGFKLTATSDEGLADFKRLKDLQGQKAYVSWRAKSKRTRTRLLKLTFQTACVEQGTWDKKAGHDLTNVQKSNYAQPQFLVTNGASKQKVSIACEADRKFSMLMYLYEAPGKKGLKAYASKEDGRGDCVAKSPYYLSTAVDFEIELGGLGCESGRGGGGGGGEKGGGRRRTARRERGTETSH